MTDGWVFGYGSLVNRATHAMEPAFPATLPGWRRMWRKTSLRDVAFLTATPDPAVEIDGLMVRVAADEWSDLDRREAAYSKDRAINIRHAGPADADVSVYAIPSSGHVTGHTDYILILSYIDVVARGFLQEFGEEGLARFFRTTTGWNAPVADDRDTPIYSRAQALTAHERGLVDRHLVSVGARFVPAAGYL